jgi:hypothetical protein
VPEQTDPAAEVTEPEETEAEATVPATEPAEETKPAPAEPQKPAEPEEPGRKIVLWPFIAGGVVFLVCMIVLIWDGAQRRARRKRKQQRKRKSMEW